MKKSIGYGIEMPKEVKEGDKNCPFTGNVTVRGTLQQGIVTSAKGLRTCTVQIERQVFVPKYKRYKKKYSKIHVHNPASIDAKEGDLVEFAGCRPISKTKSAVIVRVVKRNEE